MPIVSTPTLRVSADGTVKVYGIEQPEGTVHTYHPGTQILTVKVAGRTYWASRGSRGYAGAEIQVYRLVKDVTPPDTTGFRVFRTEAVMDIPVKADTTTATRVMHAAIRPVTQEV